MEVGERGGSTQIRRHLQCGVLSLKANGPTVGGLSTPRVSKELFPKKSKIK
jgi:hypothetical protein